MLCGQQKLVTGKLTDDDWDKIAVAADSLNHSRILIDDDSSVTVADINAKCRVEDLGWWSSTTSS